MMQKIIDNTAFLPEIKRLLEESNGVARDQSGKLDNIGWQAQRAADKPVLTINEIQAANEKADNVGNASTLKPK